MNAEQLHDALTLLPEDLIAEVDALRRAPRRKIVYWKRILPVAACLCLVLLTAPTVIALISPKGAMESAADAVQAPAAAPAEAARPEKAHMENGIWITPAGEAESDELPSAGVGAARSETRDTGGTLTARYLPPQPSDTEGGQNIALISSRAELETYLAAYDDDGTLAAACEDYDDAYFEDNQLVLLLTALYRPAAGYSGNVLLPMESGVWSAEQTDSGWTLRVRDMVPDVSSRDVVRQHILLEIPGAFISPADTLTLKKD